MFKKFLEVERLGKTEVEGILQGVVHVFPKLDGTCGSVWMETKEGSNPELHCGSRNRELSFHDDNRGFYKFIQGDKERYLALLTTHPSWIIYGEWLVKHTVKGYEEDAWEKFYIFDVFDTETLTWVEYDTYSPVMANLSLNIIPRVKLLTNPEVKDIQVLMKHCTGFKVKEGELGEGLVIKNYAFRSPFGHPTYGKLVRPEFAELNGGEKARTGFTKHNWEEEFVEKYVTRGRIEKILAKLSEVEPDKKIPRFLESLYFELLTEEMYDFVKKSRPTIAFGILKGLTFQKAKSLTPELFGLQQLPVSLSKETPELVQQQQ